MHNLSRLVLATALLLASGCAGRTEEPGPPVNELEANNAEVCPRELPRDPDDEFAFGTDADADQLPSRGAIDSAWVCTYGLADARETWTRSGEPAKVSDLQAVREGIDALNNESPGACTSDLGPLYLIVTVREGQDLTGYAVDDFGCGSVRITDDPFRTVPGEATQAGTVSGVLHEGEALLSIAIESAGGRG